MPEEQMTDDEAAALLDRLASYFRFYGDAGSSPTMTVAELAGDLWDSLGETYTSAARLDSLHHAGLLS